MTAIPLPTSEAPTCERSRLSYPSASAIRIIDSRRWRSDRFNVRHMLRDAATGVLLAGSDPRRDGSALAW